MQTNGMRKQCGVTLIAACLSMLAVGILGGALLSTITTTRHQRLHFDVGQRAFYAAESGRSYAYSRKAGNPFYSPAGTFLMDSGDRFTLSTTRVDTNLVVTSTGVAHGGTDREATRSVTFLLDYVPALGIDDVFVWAQQVRLRGAGTVAGSGGTIVITGDMIRDDLSGGTDLAVTTIFVEGDVQMTPGAGVTVGSSVSPGNVYISGDLLSLGGQSSFYGDVHVKGNLHISHGRFYGNMYVHGDVHYAGGAFTLFNDSRIHYAGELVNWPDGSLDMVAHKFTEDMPPFPVIDETAKLRDPAWYTDRGYSPAGELETGLRIYTSDAYEATINKNVANVVIVSESESDEAIKIRTIGGATFSGVLVAPNGSVVFRGRHFQGVVVAKDEFYVDAGSPDITFLSITDFFDDPDDYPFEIAKDE